MDQETEHLHRNSVRSSGTGEAAVPPIVDDVLSAPGRSLDPTVRRFMESRIGHDFSQVRVHADARAADSAAAVNALAYTVGQDIVFGPGRYAPQTSEGRRLLAHELTHVVQQRASRQTTSAMPGQAATQSRRALRRTPAPAGPTQTPFVGPTQDDGTPPAWATEDLKRKLTAVVLAEADPGQEDDVMWIYINLVTEFEGEAGLEKSSAFKRKGREYRIYLYVLGDDTYGADRLQAGQTIADYCTNNGWFKRERVPRVQPLRTKVEQMLTAPESSPYKGWTGQGSLMDFNRNSEGDDYWKWARAYFGLQQQGSVNEIYVKMLPPKTPAGLTTVIFNGDAIKAYFAAHPDKLPAQVPLYAH